MTSLLLFLMTLAPVPTWMFPEPAPVGTVVKYGLSSFKVSEIRTHKRVKYYRLMDHDRPYNQWTGWWVEESCVLRCLHNKQATWDVVWHSWDEVTK